MEVLSWPHRIKYTASRQGLVLSQTRTERALYKGRKKQQDHLHLHHQTLMMQGLLWAHGLHRIGSVKEKPFYTGLFPTRIFLKDKTQTIYLRNNTLLFKNEAGCRIQDKQEAWDSLILSLPPLFSTSTLQISQRRIFVKIK